MSETILTYCGGLAGVVSSIIVGRSLLLEVASSCLGSTVLSLNSLRSSTLCTCRRRLITTSHYAQSNSVASTSTLPTSTSTSTGPFEELLPNKQLPYLKTSILHRKSRYKRLKSFRPVDITKIPLLHATKPITTFHPTEYPKYLPVLTRERNYLLSSLRTQVYHPSPSPNAVWKALIPVLQYPTVVPTLPASRYPLSAIASTEESDQGDSRQPIQLSLLELRRIFTILSKSRPYTREGLDRLLVIVELLAMRTNKNLPLTEVDSLSLTGGNQKAGVDEVLGELRGGGTGLRDKDWIALMAFAARNRRSIRPTVETESVTSLFSQWSRIHTLGGRSPHVPIAMYNTLLYVATKSRSWELLDGIEDRMTREGIKGDLFTVGIKLKRDDNQGKNVLAVWTRFEEGIMSLNKSTPFGLKGEKTKQVLWNTMLWILLRRGMMDDGMKMYRAMQEGKAVSLGSLTPKEPSYSLPTEEKGVVVEEEELNPYWIIPPLPTIETYSSLIQSFSHRGDLKTSLAIFRDMVTPPLLSSSSSKVELQPKRLPTYATSIRIFFILFKGFVQHAPFHDYNNSLHFDPLLLSGKRINSNSTNLIEPFAPLRRYNSKPTTPGTPTLTDSNPWTFKALQSLFQAFLALSTPPSTSPLHTNLPFEGTRIAPTSKQLWWLFLAFKKVPSETMDPHEKALYILNAWEETESVFGNRFGKGKGGWSELKIDNRMRNVILRLRFDAKAVIEWRNEMGLIERKDGRVE